MRRPLVIASVLALMMAVPAVAAPKQRCSADIVDAAGSYQGSAPSFVLDLDLKTAGPACSSATFSVYVLDDLPTADPEPVPLIAQQSRSGDGAMDSVWFSLIVSDDDATICLWATSQMRARFIDRAPDNGCVELTAPTTGALASFD